MKVLVHFVGNSGFECCIEKSGGLFRAGWKSDPKNEFTFIRCAFNKQFKTRINQWTTFSAANKEYQQMIKNHKLVNFK